VKPSDHLEKDSDEKDRFIHEVETLLSSEKYVEGPDDDRSESLGIS
jgi:hypothetical protein